MLCKFSSKCLLASLCLVLLANPLEAFLRSIQLSRPSHHYGSRGKCSQTIAMVADENTAPERRAALRLACSVTVSVLLGEAPRAARAASDVEQKDEVGEQVRKAAARLPGMGQPDVAYPVSLAGRWKATRTLAGIDFPTGEAAADPALVEALQKKLNVKEEFPMRFIRNGDRVVADRAFNAEQEQLAVNRLAVAAQWQPSNPNVLTVTFPDGAVTEIKVTKRSVSMADDASGVEFSEYSRVARLAGPGALVSSVPDIGAKWERGKFRLAGARAAEGILLEYVLPGDRPDPRYAVMKLKYRVALARDDSE